MKKKFILVFCFVFIILSVCGCAGKGIDTSSLISEIKNEVKELGTGATTFYLTVTDKDKNNTAFAIKTDKTTVGEALKEVSLIEGENGPYGLRVIKVNGIVADYDIDKTYWAFYIGGNYANTGVDKTNIKEGETYSFRVEK